MNVFRPGFLLLTGMFFLLLIAPPLRASLSPQYQNLQSTLNSGRQPDSTAINRLPPPETPEELWLKSRVTTRIDSALKLARRAIRNVDSPTRKSKYLSYWLRWQLLNGAGDTSLQFLETTLSRIGDSAQLSGEVWYLSGQLARLAGNLNRASRYFSRVRPTSRYHGRSLLAEASVFLSLDRADSAHERLDRYFLSPEMGNRPLYWVLKGRYFEEVGSDSEAYIAYGHVINHYTRSLVSGVAEKRITDLPLPKRLYPGRSTDGTKTVQSPSPRTSRADDAGGRFGIQAGSFRDSTHARRLRRSLRNLTDFHVIIRSATVKGRRYHRVLVTGIPSRVRAAKLLDTLKDSGYNGFVVTP